MYEIILTCVLIWILYKWLTVKPNHFPPGPPMLPFVGSIPFIKSYNFHFEMEKMREKYGPIIGMKFGSLNVVGVCGPKEVAETLKRDEFQGRPKFVISVPLFERGIMFTSGSYWLENRRFALRHLRDFGFGKSATEDMIHDEIEDFFENVMKDKSQIQMSCLFNPSAINVLWSMMAGQRLKRDDPEFQQLLFYLNRTFRNGNVSGGVLGALPFLRFIFPKWTGYSELLENTEFFTKFFKESIDEHRRNMEEEAKDLIDVYIKEIETKDSLYDESTIYSVCNELFSAGTESTGNTLSFAILYLILYPELQREIFDEVDKVIGRDRKPTITDKARLPRVEAFLSEVMRVNTIAPLTVPHCSTKEATINGYTVPENTLMVISLWAMFQDKEHWGDPENFRPSRFLDKDGKYVKDDWLNAFGIGKRICLGENLARTILFLFFVSLVQKYEFSIPEGHPRPSTLCLPGFTTAPQPFEAAYKQRN